MPAEIKEVVLMKLVGDLKDKVEKAENQEAAKRDHQRSRDGTDR